MRTEKKLTQEAVARAAGIDRSTYTNIENGKRKPSPGVAIKIADVLSFDWTLFYVSDEAKA